MLSKHDRAKLNKIAKRVDNIFQELTGTYVYPRIDNYIFDLVLLNMDLLQQYICICLRGLEKKKCCSEGSEFYYSFLKPALNTWNKMKKTIKDIKIADDLDIDTALMMILGKEVVWAYFRSLTPVLVMENKQEHLHTNNRAFVLDKMIKSVGGKNEQKSGRTT